MTIYARYGFRMDRGIININGIQADNGILAPGESQDSVDMVLNQVGALALLRLNSPFEKAYQDNLYLNNGIETHEAYYCSITKEGVFYSKDRIPTGIWKALYSCPKRVITEYEYIGVWQKVSD